MIPNMNLVVGEMGFMFCDVNTSVKKTLQGDINSTICLVCFLFCQVTHPILRILVSLQVPRLTLFISRK